MTDRPEPTPAALYARVSRDRQGGVEPENTRGGGSRRGRGAPLLEWPPQPRFVEG